ncbi:MAG: CYTH domain-containing protein [Hespellia sp.]|nr:CYTH domain-containing protein [Hespellia sp.]
MEIERKYLIDKVPIDLNTCKSRRIEQGYLSTEPVVRVRRDNDAYFLTYKSKGLMVREEYNLPLTKESYEHLREKADGRLITKTRYEIPLALCMPDDSGLIIELDFFEGELAPLILAEVEFPNEELAHAFVAPDWFGEDVTFSSDYHNSTLSRK